ncbi:PstA family ABC transporter permease [Desulfogranum japonicum]|uniref:PstA family ABC transporter permease n=1 Tax=Desulfogranum japonicum TaxID=231447 RepID=UPI00042387A9|nr:ABC transporter permease subunit [Desulfogranum japonicum]
MMRRFLEASVSILSWLCTLCLLLSLFTLVGFLFFKGGSSLQLSLIFGNTAPLDAILLKRQVFEGIFPAMVGTLFLIVGAMCIATPIGIAGGIYMAEYCSSKIQPVLNLAFDILAGIPSIVVGLAGLLLTILLHRYFRENIIPCLFISSCSLAFLVVPYLIRSTQTALESTAPLVRQTAPALGASQIQNIFLVLLPNSLPDILSGIILACGRCAEDTAVIMLTGVVATAGIPSSAWGQYEALPFYIYYISSQYTGPDELARGYGAAIILLLLCTTMLVCSLWVQRKITTILLYR